MLRTIWIGITIFWMASMSGRADIVYTFSTDSSQTVGGLYPPATVSGSFSTDDSGNLVGYDFVFVNPNVSYEFTPSNSFANNSEPLDSGLFSAHYPFFVGEALTLSIYLNSVDLTALNSQFFNLVYFPPLNFSYIVGAGDGHWTVAVPEPASSALLGSACVVLIALAGAARLRRVPSSRSSIKGAETTM
jgi:hypothetical protein